MHVFTKGCASLATLTRRAAITAGLLLVAGTTASSAQTTSTSGPTISVHAGVFDYDLNGVGTVRHFAARGELPVNSYVFVEASLGYSRPGPRPEERTTVLIPEVQAQLQYPFGRVAPYLGVGAGSLMALAGDAQDKFDAALSLSTAAGARVRLAERLGARAELRVRSVEMNGNIFAGATAELTAGLSWHLGR
jgi:hypothetical protein